jgi:hypothetical protein
MPNPWRLSDKFDPAALPLADAHYNRRKVGSPQFVPPGRSVVLLTPSRGALWVTSWPFADFVRHAWPGAWVNSLFRREDGPIASELIAAAVAMTRAIWDPPPLGIVSFVDASQTRRKRDPGRCYRKAGWSHVGFTKGGLWVFQQLPHQMPGADSSGLTDGMLPFGIATSFQEQGRAGRDSAWSGEGIATGPSINPHVPESLRR